MQREVQLYGIHPEQVKQLLCLQRQNSPNPREIFAPDILGMILDLEGTPRLLQ